MFEYIGTSVCSVRHNVSMFPRSHVLKLVTWLPMWLAYPSSHSLTSSIKSATSYSSSTNLVKPRNNSSTIYSTCVSTASVILSPLSSSSSLKILLISKSFIRDVVFSSLIWCPLFLIMPPVRLSASDYYNRLVTIILLLSEIMPLCSHCVEKKLVCVAIAAFTGRQPSSCVECIQANMQLSCDV